VAASDGFRSDGQIFTDKVELSLNIQTAMKELFKFPPHFQQSVKIMV
jgi:hypothetical protein